MSVRTVIDTITGPLLLAVLTAVVTLVLFIGASLILGAESRQRAEESRCYAALTNAMLHEMLDHHGIDDEQYPRINLAGVDCSFLAEPPASP